MLTQNRHTLTFGGNLMAAPGIDSRADADSQDPAPSQPYNWYSPGNFWPVEAMKRKLQPETPNGSPERGPDGAPAPIREHNVYVKFFSADLDDEGLAALFRPCGRVVSSKVLRYHDGRSKQVGFVQMGSHEEAVEACRLHTMEAGGARQLHVALAMAKGDRQRAFQARREARRAAEPLGVPLGVPRLNIPTSPFASPPSTLPAGLGLGNVAMQAELNALYAALQAGANPLSPPAPRTPDSQLGTNQLLNDLAALGIPPAAAYSAYGNVNALTPLASSGSFGVSPLYQPSLPNVPYLASLTPQSPIASPSPLAPQLPMSNGANNNAVVNELLRLLLTPPTPTPAQTLQSLLQSLPPASAPGPPAPFFDPAQRPFLP